MTLDDQVKLVQVADSHILYDVALLENPQPTLFQRNPVSAATSRDRQNPPPCIPSVDCPGDQSTTQPVGQATGIGRGKVCFFQHAGLKLVCRHYYRGGLMARFLKDWYFGRRLEHSRAFREWCLLRTLQKLALPVPVPVAAHVHQKGWFYQADLLTQALEQTETLADTLLQQPISDVLWRQVGRCIRRFHDANVFHADLNARNILLQGEDGVYLIDFDRGSIRPGTSAWKQQNLQRLYRSLKKFQAGYPTMYFSEQDWQHLQQGYEA